MNQSTTKFIVTYIYKNNLELQPESWRLLHIFDCVDKNIFIKINGLKFDDTQLFNVVLNFGCAKINCQAANFNTKPTFLLYSM